MKGLKFTIHYETYFKVDFKGHKFTIYRDTPARFIPILSDGRPVSLDACGTLEEAVTLAFTHCL